MTTITELQAAEMQCATAENMGMSISVSDDVPEDQRESAEAEKAVAFADLDEYLVAFVPGEKCPRCDSNFADLGSFFWGIANGEGFCSQCRYPVRVCHKTKKGWTFERILAYHPSVLCTPESENNEAEER